MRLATGGHELDYEVRGEGRPIVMIHGVTGDRRVMVEAAEEALGVGWQRVYLDLPGHGASKGDPARASADHIVEALAELVQKVAAEAGRPVCLFGYSYGGYLAQGLIARLHGTPVSASVSDPVLAGAFLGCPIVEPDWNRRRVPARMVQRGAELTFTDDREREDFFEVAVQHTSEVLAAFRRAVHPANLAADRTVVGVMRDRYALSRPTGEALKAFQGPVTIACGRHDHWAGFEDAATMLRLLPRAEMTVVADVGHLLPIEAPARWKAIVEGWTRRL
jgi:pimeloyl-ACP methyl ester carboxylesterase